MDQLAAVHDHAQEARTAGDAVRHADSDATLEMMTAEGMEDFDTQKSDIEIAKRMLGIQKEFVPEQIFDFRFVREVYKELRYAGWDRVLKSGIKS